MSRELYGVPPKSIRPFDTYDFYESFFDGAVWGGFGLALLALGAWLISVARSRVNFTTLTRSHQSQANQSALDAHLNSNPTNPHPADVSDV